MRRLALYGVGVLATAFVLELGCRHFHSLLHDAQYRALFKAALFDRKPPVPLVFFGTSRTGEALRPSIIDRQNKTASFNVSVQYSSLEILDYLTQRFNERPGMAHVFIEVSASQSRHLPLPWSQPESHASDFDGRVFAWLEGHSALVERRQSFVLENLSRLVAVLALSPIFDGSEQFGIDYIAALRGHPPPVDNFADARLFTPRIVVPEPAAAAQDDATLYAAIAQRFTARGVAVTFFVPPAAPSSAHEERQAYWQTLIARVSALSGCEVWDFSPAEVPEKYFRDTIHLNHQGGALLSYRVAERLREVQAALQ